MSGTDDIPALTADGFLRADVYLHYILHGMDPPVSAYFRPVFCSFSNRNAATILHCHGNSHSVIMPKNCRNLDMLRHSAMFQVDCNPEYDHPYP